MKLLPIDMAKKLMLLWVFCSYHLKQSSNVADFWHFRISISSSIICQRCHQKWWSYCQLMWSKSNFYCDFFVHTIWSRAWMCLIFGTLESADYWALSFVSAAIKNVESFAKRSAQLELTFGMSESAPSVRKANKNYQVRPHLFANELLLALCRANSNQCPT